MAFTIHYIQLFLHHKETNSHLQITFDKYLLIKIIFCFTLYKIIACMNNENEYIKSCEKREFQCYNGVCILENKTCDGRSDCSDLSDEIHCDINTCHGPDWFRCSQLRGPCLSSELVCNNYENCPAGEDEDKRICQQHYRMSIEKDWQTFIKKNCTNLEYTCQSDRSCIPLQYKCDGINDCKDNSDELDGCLQAKIQCQGYICDNRHCLLNKDLQCDGVNVCGDGSDEKNCIDFCNPDLGKYLCHDRKNCISLNKVCNDQNDCFDGSDESMQCNKSELCYSRSCPASSKCYILPDTGPTCICSSGFRYSIKENTCIDINECEEQFGICSHKCLNLPGHYKCYCDAGYILQSDNQTCRIGNNEQMLLLYTMQVAVMGVRLPSKRIYTIAENLTKVIGVTYDGEDIYWTNIQNESESIVRSNINGMYPEILLTSGLDKPEDLAIDWLSGNIYFSDNAVKHIGVCGKDGRHCVVLITKNVHQPRGIALWPHRGQLFWTDWGIRPKIVRASMDGNNVLIIIDKSIYWPNGIAIDTNNDRIYWVDGKLATIESSKTDGSNRRIILSKGILKHPYGLAVFEDRLYWSDWGTKSIHSCNKFNGKDQQLLLKDRTIYSVYIYHSMKQSKKPHACQGTICSHLCLLAENHTFSCACSGGMKLANDKRKCVNAYKRQRLYLGINYNLLEMEHTTFGRHVIMSTFKLNFHIHEMIFNNINGTIFIADNYQHLIGEYQMKTNRFTTLLDKKSDNITDLAFDYLSHNLYWSDSVRRSIGVYSIQTGHHAIVCNFSINEIPIALEIIPEDGIMFVALKLFKYIRFIKMLLNGEIIHSNVFNNSIGTEIIKFMKDNSTKTLYWTDSSLNRISFSKYQSKKAYTFRWRLRAPFDLAMIDDNIFWTELNSKTIYWTHKNNMGPVKHFDIDVNPSLQNTHILPNRIPIIASTKRVLIDHPCQHSNGGCSHLCFTLNKFAATCSCPEGFIFTNEDKRSCIEISSCEFYCHSGICLPSSQRCNGQNDCLDKSDELYCDKNKYFLPICTSNEFQCHNKEQCIPINKHCNGIDDCNDKSDEEYCNNFYVSKVCLPNERVCDNGNCFALNVMCDGTNDCGDNSDENNCSCGLYEFHCKNSGECINLQLRCDNEIDCEDGSDEENCNSQYMWYNISKMGNIEKHQCDRKTFDCKNGQCIDYTLVCDGFDDCINGIDESPLCKTVCLSNANICDGICQPTPTGPLCTCFNGYDLDVDQYSCIDINECNIYEPCSQICINTYGSFRCSCYKEFALSTDKVTCKSIYSKVSYLTSSHDKVYRLLEWPMILRVAWSTTDLKKIISFDINIRKRVGYFTTITDNNIYQVDVDNGIILSVINVQMPIKLSVDYITDNIYVISRADDYEIKVCSFIKKICATIIKTSSTETIKTLHVDAYNKYLFFVVTEHEIFDKWITRIVISNLDGTKQNFIQTNNNNTFVNAIASDPYKKILYYMDIQGQALYAVSYTNSTINTVIQIIERTNAIVKPNSITWFENQIYIISFGSKELIRCNLFGKHICDAVYINISNPEDIVIDNISIQPIDFNPCFMAKCEGLCIPTSDGYQCMCNDSIVNHTRLCTFELNRNSSNDKSIIESTPFTFGIISSFIFILLLIVGIGYFYYHRNRITIPFFDRSAHFQSPLAPILHNGSINYNKIHNFECIFKKNSSSSSPLCNIEQNQLFQCPYMETSHT